mmetsp:Transcript_123368/g.343612  ORF Transcript_123368/g.343612 Transcript_123368/m.343612 type:complete len:207 (-) Transcript_123368:210-830(-)
MAFAPPARAPRVLNASAWARALNNRDFQDKQLRFVQYGSRGLAYCLLRGDEQHHVGRKLFRLYMQLSLSRKAFRAFRWLADVKKAIDHLRESLRETSDVVDKLSALQWFLMAVHIFWDNMFFHTHSTVGLIARPDSLWWSNSSANQRQKNWRAMSDIVGLVAAWVRHRRASRLVRSFILEGGAATAGPGMNRDVLPVKACPCRWRR